MSVVTRPDLFPAGTTVAFYAMPAPLLGEVLRRNEGTNPANWKPVPTKVGEAEVAANGELAVTASVGGTCGGRVLCAAEVGGVWVTLVAQAHVSRGQKVKTTSTLLLTANPERQGLEVVNAGTTPMFLGLGVAAALKEGLLLAANGSWDGRLAGVVWSGAVYGIAETAEEAATLAEF